MPASWMFPDSRLQEQLNAWLAEVKPTQQWYVALFQNNYTPLPTSNFADFTEANYAGYDGAKTIDMDAWPNATVVDHVAISTNSVTYSWTAAPSGVSPQTVYGYFVYNEDDVLVYAERWENSVAVNNGTKVDLVLKLKQQVRTP